MGTPQIPRAKKSLGQHFLTDPIICRRIASLLDAEPANSILEIGPGAGALTRELMSLHPARLMLLEKDQYWANYWSEKGVEVVAGDALEFPWEKLALDVQWKLAGNLPYNVASPLIWDIVSRCHAWDRAVFMVQKEVAQRICASPGNGSYGALSVWVQCHAIATLSFKLGPGAFRPPPKVDSGVVLLTPQDTLPPHPGALAFVVKICFQKRRKQLGNILRPFPKLLSALDALRIAKSSRPEELTPGQFVDLAAAWDAAPLELAQ